MAPLGVPVGGRVRKMRAGEDQSALIPEETTSERGGTTCKLVQRTHADQLGVLPKEEKQASLVGLFRWMEIARCA